MKKNKVLKFCVLLIILGFLCLSIVGCTGIKAPINNTSKEEVSETTAQEGYEGNKAISNDTLETVSATENYNDNTLEPIIVDDNNIGSIKVGDFVSVSGPANTYSSRDGIIKVGGNDSGIWAHAGIRISIKNKTNPNSFFEIEADQISPGDYESTFYTHPPIDFSKKPSRVGDSEFSGCMMTIIGTVNKILVSEEDNQMYGLSLGPDSIVKYLEFYYE
ncbi:MAG: hypothetical protein J5590_02670 [Clostridia bacterium]|nr:hypothetical protein [Clostridia bacterium]